ncbi:MAG: serine/threonine-protein kinase [Planctomycetota bacterium]
MENSSEGDSGFSLDDMPVDFGHASSEENVDLEFPSIPGYHIHRLLGAGGMGVVYEASRESEATRRFALKTLRIGQFQTLSEAARQRFRREVSLLKDLSHPNIVPVVDSGEYSQQFQQIPFYVMPLLTGGDLSELLAHSSINSRETLAESVGRLTRLIAGLAEAHARGVVHRDIKPRNIFVDQSGEFILGDFGLAKGLEEDAELTSTIGHMGTTPYAPPEQLLSAKTADRRADIYAIGVILYQFSCYGLRPFSPDHESGDDTSETSSIAEWQRSSHRKVPLPGDRTRHLSDASLDFIVEKCLSYYPEHRYQSLEDLSHDLTAWKRGDRVCGSVAERLRKYVAGPIQRNPRRVVAVGIGLLMLLGVVVFAQVNSLTADVSQAQQEKEVFERKREQERRSQLDSILPRLPGEPRYYETQRTTDPDRESVRLQKEAWQLCKDLRLEDSTRFEDRHRYWIVRRNEPEGERKVEKYRSRLELCEIAITNSKLARDESQIAEACSDICRSYRLVFEVFWDGFNNESEYFPDFRDRFNEHAEEFQRVIRSLESRSQSKASDRILQLSWMDFQVRHPDASWAKVYELCSNDKGRFHADQLRRDACTRLQTWYLAWYIYQSYFIAAKVTEQSLEDQVRIVSAWLENVEATPHEVRTQNLQYIDDKRYVQDLQADVFRGMGRLEDARRIYQELWDSGRYLREFYRKRPNVWKDCDQVLSSLLAIATETKDRSSLLECYRLGEQLNREWIALMEENSTLFQPDTVSNVHYELGVYVGKQLNEGETVSSTRLQAAIRSIEKVRRMNPDGFRGAKSLDAFLRAELMSRESERKPPLSLGPVE